MGKPVFYLIIFSFALSLIGLSGCETSKTVKGAGIGAATGAAVGAIIGHQSDHRTEGAVIGGVVGGTLGALIGKRLDKQAEELEEVSGVENVTVDQANQKIEATLKINFDVDKAVIRPTEAVKLDEFFFPSIPPGQPDGAHSGFGPGAYESYFFYRWVFFDN